jgi:hypothetical protein
LSKAGDRAIDDGRVDRFDRVIVEPVFLQAARPKVLDEDLTLRRKPAHDLRTFALGKIERDGALVSVGGEIIGGVAFAVLDEGRPPRARVVARTWLFDLDYVSAEIAQDLCRPRAGQHT